MSDASGWKYSNSRTSPLLSKYHQKYTIKKTKLSTEGDPIHCVITSQTKYSEPLNLVLSWMISASVETCSSWFRFLIRLWREVLVSLFLNQRVTIPTKIKTSFATQQRYCFVFCNPFFNNTQFLNDHMCWNWMCSFFSSSDSLSLFRNNYRFDIVSDKRLCSSSYHNMFWCLTSCSRDGFINNPQDNGLYKE